MAAGAGRPSQAALPAGAATQRERKFLHSRCAGCWPQPCPPAPRHTHPPGSAWRRAARWRSAPARGACPAGTQPPRAAPAAPGGSGQQDAHVSSWPANMAGNRAWQPRPAALPPTGPQPPLHLGRPLPLLLPRLHRLLQQLLQQAAALPHGVPPAGRKGTTLSLAGFGSHRLGMLKLPPSEQHCRCCKLVPAAGGAPDGPQLGVAHEREADAGQQKVQVVQGVAGGGGIHHLSAVPRPQHHRVKHRLLGAVLRAGPEEGGTARHRGEAQPWSGRGSGKQQHPHQSAGSKRKSSPPCARRRTSDWLQRMSARQAVLRLQKPGRSRATTVGSRAAAYSIAWLRGQAGGGERGAARARMSAALHLPLLCSCHQ